MTDIVERLRELEAVETELACEGDCPPEATANYRYATTCGEAADEICRLLNIIADARTENFKLRAALETISDITDYGTETATWSMISTIHNANVIARAALEGK